MQAANLAKFRVWVDFIMLVKFIILLLLVKVDGHLAAMPRLCGLSLEPPKKTLRETCSKRSKSTELKTLSFLEASSERLGRFGPPRGIGRIRCSRAALYRSPAGTRQCKLHHLSNSSKTPCRLFITKRVMSEGSGSTPELLDITRLVMNN